MRLFVVLIQSDGDRVDECLIVGLGLTRCDRRRLPVSLSNELGRPNIGHPDLHGP
jgi:hypothetical protein